MMNYDDYDDDAVVVMVGSGKYGMIFVTISTRGLTGDQLTL
jgi:hypothetical protein